MFRRRPRGSTFMQQLHTRWHTGAGKHHPHCQSRPSREKLGLYRNHIWGPWCFFHGENVFATCPKIDLYLPIFRRQRSELPCRSARSRHIPLHPTDLWGDLLWRPVTWPSLAGANLRTTLPTELFKKKNLPATLATKALQPTSSSS